MSRVKIQVTVGDDSMMLEADDIEINQERGTAMAFNPGGGCASIEPNGQSRFSIRGWRGCRSYDDFVPKINCTVMSVGELQDVPNLNRDIMPVHQLPEGVGQAYSRHVDKKEGTIKLDRVHVYDFLVRITSKEGEEWVKNLAINKLNEGDEWEDEAELVGLHLPKELKDDDDPQPE